MVDEHNWEVGLAGHLRERYALTDENRPLIRLEPARVPPSLRHLIPLAERFGISDDLIRADRFAKTPRADLDDLCRAVAENEELLDEWLAGSEADGPSYSDEYIAFSAMRMAADGV